jgi:hypothetical protein
VEREKRFKLNVVSFVIVVILQVALLEAQSPDWWIVVSNYAAV